MKCKLCLQDKPLLKKSHITSNFLYKELRDENNSFRRVDLQKVTGKKIQTGFFEPNILCKDCDNVRLGDLEGYASKILYGGAKGMNLRHERTPDGAEWMLCDGVDYKKFKLFLLSLIWRFSISKDEFYRFVNLGEHEEIIRQMILKYDAGSVLDYPCTIMAYKHHKDLPSQIISQPTQHRGSGGGICYSMIMNGFIYTFYISKNLIPSHISEITINEKGQLKVIKIPKLEAIKIIRKYMGLKNLKD